MEPIDLLQSNSDKYKNLMSELLIKLKGDFNSCCQVVVQALKNGNTIFWCGNGGSAAESSHLATELIGRFKNNRKSLPSISLNADTSAITCIANDFGYEEIFARQLEGLSKKGDVLIALSTSGTSENILRVLNKSRDLGVFSIAMLGKSGGLALSLADVTLIVDSFDTARIQEVHLFLGHTLCEYAEIALGIN